MPYDLRNSSRYTEALAAVLGQNASSEPRIALDYGLMSADLATLARALVRFCGHATLGPWSLGFLNEEAAGQVVRAAGGTPESFRGRLLGLAMDGERLAVASYAGADHVHVADPEYRQVKLEAFFLKDWLEKLFCHPGQLASSVRGAMREVFTELDATAPNLLSAETDPNHEALRQQPDPDTTALLKAGGHMYWSFVGNGPVASVHKKGLRFTGDKDQRKSRNVKSTIEFGSMAPEGHCGLLLCQHALHRVEVPSGKMVELKRDGDRTIHTFAHLRNDLVALRQDCEVVLCRIGAAALEVSDRVTSLDLGAEGTLQRVFDGTWFVVSNNGQEVSWLFRVVEGKLQIVHRLDGFLDPLDDIFGPIPGNNDRLGLTLWSKGKARMRCGVLERP